MKSAHHRLVYLVLLLVCFFCVASQVRTSRSKTFASSLKPADTETKAKVNEAYGKLPLSFEVNRGGKFVVYRYCVSVVVLTIMQGTDIYFVRSGESRVIKGLPWTLLSVVAGWWGIPWGPIRTVHSIWINSHGGTDVTAQIAGAMGLQGVNWDTAAAGGS